VHLSLLTCFPGPLRNAPLLALTEQPGRVPLLQLLRELAVHFFSVCRRRYGGDNVISVRTLTFLLSVSLPFVAGKD